jgi:hypothetical protein
VEREGNEQALKQGKWARLGGEKSKPLSFVEALLPRCHGVANGSLLLPLASVAQWKSHSHITDFATLGSTFHSAQNDPPLVGALKSPLF